MGRGDRYRVSEFRNRSFLLLVVLAALLLIVAPGITLGGPGPSLHATGRLDGESTIGRAASIPGTTADCNGPVLTPAAVDLASSAIPAANLSANGTLTATWQAAVLGTNLTNATVPLTIPSLFAEFPSANGTPATIYFAPHTLNVTGLGWANASSRAERQELPGGFRFNGTAPPFLTSEKIALMGPASYGNLTIGVRWGWNYTAANGSSTGSGWTTPSANATAPFLPSIFYPAPFVGPVGPVPIFDSIGGYFVEAIGGFIGGAEFRAVLEYANGTEFRSVYEYPPANATEYTLRVPVENLAGNLTPGNYLFHLHDECHAIIQIAPVRAAYASNATVNVSITPPLCGPIQLNGTAYGNGSSAEVVPSPKTPLPLAAPACTGALFQSWNVSGYLSVANASAPNTTLTVINGGTLAAVYFDDRISVAAGANLTIGLAPLTVGFFVNASGGLPPYTFNWSSGNGATATGADPTFTYPVAGNFTANVTVRDARGYGVSQPIPVRALAPRLPLAPAANHTVGDAPADIGFSVAFTGGLGPYTYHWQFGDGSSSTASAPTHAYPTPGNYTVTVTVRDIYGQNGSAALPVAIYPALNVSLRLPAAPVAPGAAIELVANVSGGAPPMQYRWDTDGENYTTSVGELLYTAPNTTGRYPLTVSVVDGAGRSVNFTAVLVVALPAPGGGRGSPAPVGEWVWYLLTAVIVATVVAAVVLALFFPRARTGGGPPGTKAPANPAAPDRPSGNAAAGGSTGPPPR